jgi:glyoxylase-like metal-dependent hydrolase (beta-lactamase superfamily II)
MLQPKTEVAMGSEFRSWQVGHARITRIRELGPFALSPRELLPDATRDHVKALPWLSPDFADADGTISIDFQCFLVEAAGKKILVDTCIGEGKRLAEPALAGLAVGFLETLKRAGAGPDDVDVVICTHMHFDHVGWNTMKVDGAWQPTFPKARYLFAQVEMDHALALPEQPGEDIVGESIRPVLDAGLADLVAMDHVICEGVRLEPTPGHTPGHVAVWIESAGEAAVITGDMIHHPLQLAHPEFASSFCHDPAQSCDTRRALFRKVAGKPVLFVGSHFCEPTAGYVCEDGDAWRLRTEALATA